MDCVPTRQDISVYYFVFECCCNSPIQLVFLHVFGSTIPAGSSAIAFCFASATSIATGAERDGCLLGGIAAVLFVVVAIAVFVIVAVALVYVFFLCLYFAGDAHP